MVELTSSRVDLPPRGVGDGKPPSNDDSADVVNARNEGLSVNDPESVRSRVGLESTEVLMHILSICESTLQGNSNRLCSHKARGPVANDSVENSGLAVDVTSMGSLVLSLNGREVLEHRHMEVMSISVQICRQESLVNRIQMKRVARGRTAGLWLLSLVDINISWKRNFSTPVLSVFISAFPGGQEVLRSSQSSSQIGGVFGRETVYLPFVGPWKTCNPPDFLVEVVVSDLPRARLVNCRQLNQVDWCPWCGRFVGVRTSRLSQSMIFLQPDHEVLGLNCGTLVPLAPDFGGSWKGSQLVSSKEQGNLIRDKGCSVFE